MRRVGRGGRGRRHGRSGPDWYGEVVGCVGSWGAGAAGHPVGGGGAARRLLGHGPHLLAVSLSGGVEPTLDRGSEQVLSRGPSPALELSGSPLRRLASRWARGQSGRRRSSSSATASSGSTLPSARHRISAPSMPASVVSPIVRARPGSTPAASSCSASSPAQARNVSRRDLEQAAGVVGGGVDGHPGDDAAGRAVGAEHHLAPHVDEPFQHGRRGGSGRRRADGPGLALTSSARRPRPADACRPESDGRSNLAARRCRPRRPRTTWRSRPREPISDAALRTIAPGCRPPSTPPRPRAVDYDDRHSACFRRRYDDHHNLEELAMPMIDVYAVTGTFADKHQLAQDAAKVVMSGSRCPPSRPVQGQHRRLRARPAGRLGLQRRRRQQLRAGAGAHPGRRSRPRQAARRRHAS